MLVLEIFGMYSSSSSLAFQQVGDEALGSGLTKHGVMGHHRP